MSGELLSTGDPAPHRHELPAIPTEPHPYCTDRAVLLENAVARCGTCGQLMVSRPVDIYVHWVPLRWWHRKARAKLRVEEARRIGGVAP